MTTKLLDIISAAEQADIEARELFDKCNRAHARKEPSAQLEAELVRARKALQSWKPCVAFSNGAWPSGRIDWHPDVLSATARMKDRYRWEQSPDAMRMLINDLSDPGGIVVDPFAGTGAFGVAAIGEGRHFIGVELDGVRFTNAAERLGGVA